MVRMHELHIKNDQIKTGQLPSSSNGVTIDVPDQFIDYKRGVIDIKGFASWLSSNEKKSVVIGYTTN
jgi:hypothetical protein